MLKDRLVWCLKLFEPENVANIFNLSIRCRTFPSEWETFVIMPVHKKGTDYDPANYRSVKHNPTVSRTMELVIKNSRMSYLLELKLINREQHGLLRKTCCSSCLNDRLNAITRPLGIGRSVTAIFRHVQSF